MANLSTEEIQANFTRIDEEYEIGEALSLKDQTFVEMYANSATPSIELFGSKKVSNSKTAKGITVKVSGTIKEDIQNFLNQSFGAKLKTSTTAGASKAKSVKTVVHHHAYGLVGSGGVGKVYSGTLSTSGKNTTLDATKKYTGVVAYATTWVEVTVVHNDGSKFTIN